MTVPLALPALAARPVLRHLETFGDVPKSVRTLMESGVTRLLDSDMIITQPQQVPDAVTTGEAASSSIHAAGAEMAETILPQIEAEGLADHFKPLMRSFVRILFGLFLSPEQCERACACIDAGNHFSFLASDAGGPSLSSWRSVAHAEQGGIRLTVDKVWGIEAHREGMAIVAARGPVSFFPAAYVVWPEAYRTLRRTPHGDPFLEGRLQLGNVKGVVSLTRDERVKSGGPAVFNKYLTTVRPFFVRGLMAHVGWLGARDRVALDEGDARVHAFLSEAARVQSRAGRYDVDNVHRVLAIKFASNEFLNDLVRKGAVARFGDQRDLLAFTKMEGSSYHCYHALRNSTKSQ
ncbi:hypothetical protein LZC95_41535 [Pendulispora brunnea]|uniref:Uncharacterized protein n=1 Tax=Pendulispora brunnea TaxID=2905690 RepID=A0ABZ2K5T0_9BACT